MRGRDVPGSKMEFPETLEEHLRQVVMHIIDKTTVGLQELFRHHWTAIPGNKFWDAEIGTELWRSCHAQLKPTSKQRIVKGQINKWSIDDLAVLLPEVVRKNVTRSLTKRYFKVLKSIRDLFAPFERKNVFVSFEALSLDEYKGFMSSLSGLLAQLDTNTMKLSSITRDVISVEDLTKVNATVLNIKRETRKGKVFSIVTDLLETFPNMPPYFKEALFKLRSLVQTATNQKEMLAESLKILSFDKSYACAHMNLVRFYSKITRRPSEYFYHTRKTITLSSYRSHLFHFFTPVIDQLPKDDCSYFEFCKGIQLMIKDGLPLYVKQCDRLATDHFKRAMELGNPFGLYGFGLMAILARDYEEVKEPSAPWFVKVNGTFQNACEMLMNEVKKEPLLHKYNSCHSEFEKLGQDHFLLGYLYEKGHLPRDLDKAKALYQTAATMYNNNMASYYLGSMYYDGVGVRKSYMWAKLCWQHSFVFSKRGTPLYALIDYFLKHLEFTNAQMIAVNLRRVEPEMMCNEQVYSLLTKLQAFFEGILSKKIFDLFRQIHFFEQKWNLTAKGLTLLERLKRAELLGLKHKFRRAIKEAYDFFNLSYGTKNNSGGGGGSMSVYVHGVDESLEVDYSQLFSRLYLVAPTRIFTVTTFRHNLATNQQPKWNIKYKTRSYSELMAKFPNTFTPTGQLERFVVVEDLLYAKDGIYLLIECVLGGAINQLKLTPKTVIRLEKHLKLEYGAKITLSYVGKRCFSGNADVFFKENLGPVEVIVMGKEANMCRFCSDPILKVKECICGFGYCGKTCLEKDRKYLKHEYLCLPST